VVDNSAVTQPVSGTVTANLSATDNAVLDTIAAKDFATQTTLAAMNAKMVTGTDIGDVTINNSTGAAAVNIQDGGNTITVDGAVTVDMGANNDVTVTSGSITATQATGTNLHVVVDSAPTTAVTGTFWQATQPVSGSLAVDLGANNDVTVTSGTVTANLGATDNAVLDTIAASTAAIETAVEGTLTVTGGGGGVEYTEGDTDATITGSAVLWEDESDTLRSVSAAKPLPVNIISGAGSGGTAAADDADFIAGTTSGTPAMGVYESSPSSVTDGDLGTVGITSDRKLKVSTDTHAVYTQAWKDSSAAYGDLQLDASNNLLVSGTVTSNLSATDNAVLDAIAADGDAIQTVLGTIDGDTGAIKTAVEVIDNAISGSEMQVDVVAALPAGTNAIGKLAANSGVDIGDVDVTSLPATPAGTNAIGKLLPPDIDVTAHTNYARKYYTSAGAATDGIIWSPAAGKRWHVVTLYLQTSAASTITLEDDKAGGDDPVWKGELAANSGAVLSFTEKYPMASGEDAADLTITTSAGNVYLTCVGYEI
jgi:hypothetical protein